MPIGVQWEQLLVLINLQRHNINVDNALCNEIKRLLSTSQIVAKFYDSRKFRTSLA